MHVDVNNENNQEENVEQPENVATKPNKARYQINWKKLGTLVGGVVLLLAIVAGVWWFFWGKNEKKDDPIMVYDVVVMLKDESSNSDEDSSTLLEGGDVVLARETGREWSDTEKISFLILKMKIRQSQAQKLVEPEYVKLNEKEAIEEGLLDEEAAKEMEKEEMEQFLRKEVRARIYRIKIEELDFDPKQVRNGQPFPDQEFDWSIVEKKDKYKAPKEEE